MKNIPESLIILILFLVQFIDVLDFMVVMPLGPDFAKELGMDQANLGWLASSYTLAAAVSGTATTLAAAAAAAAAAGAHLAQR